MEATHPAPATDLGADKPGMGVIFWLSVAFIALLTFLAVFADWLPIRDPEAQGIITREVGSFEGPGWNAWFGADANGRDLFANVVHGARPALILGVVVTFASALMGGALGIIAGYARGLVDAAIMIATDTALAFPALVLLIAVRASFGNGMLVFIVMFSLLGIPGYTRIVRGATLALSEREFVEAARSMGATRSRIIMRELVPNVALPVISFAFLGFAIVIAANQLSVDTTIIIVTVASVFFSIGLAAALLAGLGGHHVAQQIAAGRALRQILTVGDTIRTDDISGVVTAIGSTSTQITSVDGDVELLPNRDLLDGRMQIIPEAPVAPPEEIEEG